VLRDQCGGVVVAAAGKGRGAAGRQEADAGLRHRDDGQRDAVLVHEFERKLRRPIRIASDGRSAARFVHRIPIELRDQMKVHVDHARDRTHAR